jgi:hypothetical protein
MTIPLTDTRVNLQTDVGDLIRQGQVLPCDHKLYDYSNTPPPPQFRVYLPIIHR